MDESNELDGIEVIYASPLESIRPELSLTPWLEPPKRFDRHAAIKLLEDLDPINFRGSSFGLTKDWLSQVCIPVSNAHSTY